MDNIFVDKFGNADFKGLGPILRGVFYLYILILMISKDVKYSPFFMLLFSFGSMLNAIRNYYIDTNLHDGPNDFFVDMAIVEYSVYSAVFFFTAVYLLTNKYVKNW